MAHFVATWREEEKREKYRKEYIEIERGVVMKVGKKARCIDRERVFGGIYLI